jgi:hypothetical protein
VSVRKHNIDRGGDNLDVDPPAIVIGGKAILDPFLKLPYIHPVKSDLAESRKHNLPALLD